jgi:integrase
VRLICNDVQVPKVTAHGMRGLHSTLTLDAEETAPVVAATLVHESAKTTTPGHYAAFEAGSAARQDRALEALEGNASGQRNGQRNEKGPDVEVRS